jgi:hypothetical protein
MSAGRIQPRAIPAKRSKATAIANAMPSAKQERAVMKPSSQLSALSSQLCPLAG